MNRQLTRRKFLTLSALGAVSAATSGLAAGFGSGSRSGFKVPYLKSNRFSDRVVVIGMDGVDPNLVKRFVAQGYLPTFKRMIEAGQFTTLATTNPPQSPVAWASFITGTNPGGHGIFDFVHRDPSSFYPYLSTSRSFGSSTSLDIGDIKIPLSSGRVELMRKGKPLWDVLADGGVPTTVCQIPSNFPIPSTATKGISGMGTPDLLGTYGTYTFYTEGSFSGPLVSAGGRVVKLRLRDHTATIDIEGPQDPFNVSPTSLVLSANIRRDPYNEIVKIDIQNQTIILKKGEWSAWTPIKFDYIPHFASTAGMVRFYVKNVHPTLELYVSPVNIDPLDPALPISSPPSYTKQLAEAIGRFHTQGFPADTKALSTGVFTDDEFVTQAKMVLEESMGLLEYQYSKFDEGFFFFYFSSTDQGGHMLWRSMHPNHPLYNPKASEEVKNSLRSFYQRMDDALKLVLDKADSRTTVFALSDHGFLPFTREFNLSTWLLKNGYTTLMNPAMQEECDVYNQVAWDKTQAYALGINGIYLNLAGREKMGIITKDEGARIKQEIATKLLKEVDPVNGKPVCATVYDSQKLYSGSHMELAPDLVVGYSGGYRISDEAVLGKFPKEVIRNRTDLWSADHCMEASLVPGILISTKQIKSTKPAIWDLAPSIIELFGLERTDAMGQSIL